MKRMIMAMAAAVVMGTTAMAQSNDSVKKVKRIDRTELVKRQTESMAKKYGLNEEQKAKLLELNTRYGGMRMTAPRTDRRRADGLGEPGQKVKRAPGDSVMRMRKPANDSVRLAKRGDADGQRPRGGMAEEDRKQYEEGLKEIMTPEQYQQYTEDMQKRPQRNGAHKGNRDGGRPQKPAAGGDAE